MHSAKQNSIGPLYRGRRKMSRKEKKTHNVMFQVEPSLNRERRKLGITWPQATRLGISTEKANAEKAKTDQKAAAA
jgi:hypothetical protein